MSTQQTDQLILRTYLVCHRCSRVHARIEAARILGGRGWTLLVQCGCDEVLTTTTHNIIDMPINVDTTQQEVAA